MTPIPLTEAQLEVLSKPRTREVFDAYVRHGSMTAPEVQRRLGTASKTIYYHIQKLADAGLLREESGGAFAPVSKQFYMPSGYQGARYELLASRSVDLHLRKAARRFRAAAEASADNPSLIDDQLSRTHVLRLKPKDREELREEIRAVIAKYMERETEEADRAISLVIVTSPIDFENS